FGDGFFPISPPNRLQKIFQLARDEAKAAGRNPDLLEFSSMAEAKADSIKALRDVGVTRVLFRPPSSNPDKLRTGLEQIAGEMAKL
ncbi:MAG: hypothetical protein ACREQE_09480, partial [Candidatus Binataceae bacterium]